MHDGRGSSYDTGERFTRLNGKTEKQRKREGKKSKRRRSSRPPPRSHFTARQATEDDGRRVDLHLWRVLSICPAESRAWKMALFPGRGGLLQNKPNGPGHIHTEETAPLSDTFPGEGLSMLPDFEQTSTIQKAWHAGADRQTTEHRAEGSLEETLACCFWDLNKQRRKARKWDDEDTHIWLRVQSSRCRSLTFNKTPCSVHRVGRYFARWQVNGKFVVNEFLNKLSSSTFLTKRILEPWKFI